MRARVGRFIIGGRFISVQGCVGVVGGFGTKAVLSGTKGAVGALTVSESRRPTVLL